MRTVYVVSPGISPPNLPVTTAAAVAVGHMMQSIALSIRILPLNSGKHAVIMARSVKIPPWNSKRVRCHFLGLISFGEILQKERNSIAKMSIGCNIPTAFARYGPAGFNNGTLS